MSDEQVSALRALHGITRSLYDGMFDLQATLEAVASGVVDATCFRAAAMNLVLPDGEVEVVAVAGSDGARAALLGTVEPWELWQELLHRGRAWGTLRYVAHDDPLPSNTSMATWVAADTPYDGPDAWHPQDTLLAPLYAADGRCLGVLSVDDPADHRLPSADEREVLELFASSAAAAIEHARVLTDLARTRDELEHAALHDQLTGLGNRRLLGQAVDALQESGEPCAVVVIDLDGFKAINDTHGHTTGDEVLVEVSRRILDAARPDDLVVRLGGDELVVLLRGEDVRFRATQVAGRVASSFSDPFRCGGQDLVVGASIGCAAGTGAQQFRDLLATADRQMYEAKRSTSVAFGA